MLGDAIYGGCLIFYAIGGEQEERVGGLMGVERRV